MLASRAPHAAADAERAAHTGERTLNDRLYLQGLERFDALLKQGDSKEADWQRLFADCPYTEE